MNSLVKSSFVLLALTSVAYAAPADPNHVPSIKDLLYPAINFAVLAGFVIWKFKKPLKDMFDKNADDVVSMMNSAEAKAKDAKAKLATLEAKLAGIENEISKIQADYHADLASFTSNQTEETKNLIARSKRDSEAKLSGEKKNLVESLNEELLDAVIAKTKTTINANANLKANATKNIVSELR